MTDWWAKGARKTRFPPNTLDEDGDSKGTLIVIERGIVRAYYGTSCPSVYEDRFFATGSGRDIALAAMHLGKTARQAVDLCSLFDVNCGNGVDELREE
jgi:hypothetical protein